MGGVRNCFALHKYIQVYLLPYSVRMNEAMSCKAQRGDRTIPGFGNVAEEMAKLQLSHLGIK